MITFSLSQRRERFKLLHQEWFANKQFWFDKDPKNDQYLIDKYFHDIKFVFDCDMTSLKQESKEVQIGAIIAYDQIPRHFMRISDIKDISYANVYSKIAAEISLTFMTNVYGNCPEYENISIAEWCFILMPFRHLNRKIKIQRSIDFMISKHNNPYISMKDKSLCKRFITNSIKDIHVSNTTEMIKKIQNDYECCSNIHNQWNEYKDILENNPREPVIMKDNNVDNIVKEFKKEMNNVVKTNDNVRIVVSLSGGVDSNVCLHLLRQYYPNVEIVAVFINYNNRDESNTELKFVKKYCAVSGVKLFHRTINEILRKDCHLNGIREIYETVTKEIRFDTYKQVSGLVSNKDNIVMMGHNKDDCFENIITNIISKHNYENLSGTEKMSKIDDIVFWRPLLNIPKKSIVEFAKATRIPFLHDSTPKWSARGKIRDNVVCSLLSINEDAVNSYFTLQEYLTENNKVIMSYIFPIIIQKFCYNDNIIEGDFEENELLANKCIWTNIFKDNNFKTLFGNTPLSFKCVQQFVEYIKRFQVKFKKMKHDNVFNNKTSFVLKNNLYANISRTRDNKIHISFHKT